MMICIFLFLLSVRSDVLLIDDMNLGRSSVGSRSLANLSGNIQNKYGERVRVVSPLQNRMGPGISKRIYYRKFLQQRPQQAFLMNPYRAPNRVPTAPRMVIKIRPRPGQNNAGMPTPNTPFIFPSTTPARPETPEKKGVSIDDEVSPPAERDTSDPASTKESKTYHPSTRAPNEDSTSNTRPAVTPGTKKHPKTKAPGDDRSSTSDSNESGDKEAIGRAIDNIIIPHIRGKKYLKKHNHNLESAKRNKKAYIRYKMIASKAKQERLNNKLKELQKREKVLENKIEKIKNEADELRTNIDARQAVIEANKDVSEDLRREVVKSEGQLRLESMEIAKLEKALKQERSKTALLKAQHKIIHEKLESLRQNDVTDDVGVDENKLNVYNNLIADLERRLNALKEKISLLTRKKNDELNSRGNLVFISHKAEETDELPLLPEFD